MVNTKAKFLPKRKRLNIAKPSEEIFRKATVPVHLQTIAFLPMQKNVFFNFKFLSRWYKQRDIGVHPKW